MFITPQSIKAETAYKQERTKREFRVDEPPAPRGAGRAA